MTTQELYAKIGGNYEHALQIMKMDKLISKYILRFRDNTVYARLKEASAALGPGEMFESAHTLKGVCANLGLDDLAAAAGVLADEFRPGQSRRMTDEQVREMLARIEEMYQRVMDGIESCGA